MPSSELHNELGTQELIDRLAARAEALIDSGMDALQKDIPSYASIQDPEFLADVRANLAEHTRILMRCLRSSSGPDPADFDFVRDIAGRRAAAGFPLADYLNAHRVFHRIVMDALVSESRRHAAADAALETARGLLEYAELATTTASDAYLEAQQLLLADEDRIRRDLLEDLLAGREPATGSRLAVANAAGLVTDAACVVVAAVPTGEVFDEHKLRHAAAWIARALRTVSAPLAVVRQREIVVVRALEHSRAGDLIAPLERSVAKLSSEGVPLAIGVSTTLAGVAELPDGYREAHLAVQGMLPNAGVVPLESLNPIDYLALRSDATTRRLMSPAVLEFVTDDARKGRPLTKTLLAYVAADLNVARAAEELFVHPNTAHYRLGRISEKTGLDLRNVGDLMQLLAAIKVADPAGEQP